MTYLTCDCNTCTDLILHCDFRLTYLRCDCSTDHLCDCNCDLLFRPVCSTGHGGSGGVQRDEGAVYEEGGRVPARVLRH